MWFSKTLFRKYQKSHVFQSLLCKIPETLHTSKKAKDAELTDKLLREYASGSVGSGEWGLVWLKKVLETRSHSTLLLRDGI